jgi:catechol 2,3-dioxygenase-like lactoylglutathione lyase family enzyme
MPPKVQPIPKSYRAITAYLYVHDAAAAIEFYTRAFGAKELFRMAGAAGRGHLLRRSDGDDPRSVWALVEHRHAHRGRAA